ncbi:FAD dependent oxidoreductase [Psychromonas ingrahamii 37]|uniref:FAD dependent oxidoreductase n=1 Tax=Psychromonas ingrahamii (strain DSM 17664 / CCUG 51855 / 37) TaxID=357804 RepID=A1SUR3_PSYIN|nr:FAD-dependent oxidoreductase [Psychromonas ingrahamii]ABM03228.1 FAD dependent oxidoreductase [Psychromonas ingrahamii 37]
MESQKKQVNKSSQFNVGIVGGGIAGSSLALYLSELGINVSLLEKGEGLVNGPPICHLHAGGNFYREISEQQCLTLLAQSIDLLRLYPFAADYRPTVLAVPKHDDGTVDELLPRLHKLQLEYQRLIDENPDNKVLGESRDYFRLFEREQLEALALQEPSQDPQSLEQWMIPIAKYVDLDKLKFPLILVQEFGLNTFRLGAGCTLSLQKNPHCQLLTNSFVTNIIASETGQSWLVDYQQEGVNKQAEFDYLINAAGFRSGKIDDMLGFKRQRLVEFKAAYIARWSDSDCLWPEVVFHGKRGTPNGMAQFTPYPGGYFQLHGMTGDITLFDEGLVNSSEQSAQPKLAEKFLKKIDYKWSEQEMVTRTDRSIELLGSYIPSFKSAKIGAKPLFGAQQIPGGDPTLRATDVSFVNERYARCEAVKASSVLTCADEIVKQMSACYLIDPSIKPTRSFPVTQSISEEEIKEQAEKSAQRRDYPLPLAHLNVAKLPLT